MTELTRRDTFRIAVAAGLASATVVASSAEEALAQAAAQKATPTFRLLLVNDIYKMSGSAPGRGGFARLAAIARTERATGVPMIYAHAGDMYSPSLMSGFDQGAHTVELLNVVPPDVFVPGNHEFDFGKEVYLKRRAEMKAPFLAANLRNEDGAPLAGHEDRRMFEMGPVKVGVFGVALATTPLMSSAAGFRFTDEMAAVQEQAKALREAGADIVVAVTHTDMTTDFNIVRSRHVDVLLTGHDHDLRIYYDNRVAMVESGEEGDYVTIVDMYCTIAEKDGKRTVTWRPVFRPIDSSHVTADPEADAIVKKYEAELSRELDVVIGKTAVDLDSRSAVVRSQEAAIGNLMADAIRASTGAEVAVINGGGIRANKQYPAGATLTRRDVLTELPFGNSTVMVEVAGKDLKEALENGLSQVDNRAGRFPQISGIKLVYDPKAPAGNRIASIEVDGKPLDPDKRYKVASNDFMYGGGDGYSALGRGRTLIGKTDGTLMANVVMAYIRKLGTVESKVEGRITAR
ncbi:MAG TPA: 5'-nucleotidase C-terminal domain-containing protein [Beijerinckiaceae bacterium]|nr:5'-nucleotidase C-terminal domain-containing protein [Beijerinckiaceae bacterium]